MLTSLFMWKSISLNASQRDQARTVEFQRHQVSPFTCSQKKFKCLVKQLPCYNTEEYFLATNSFSELLIFFYHKNSRNINFVESKAPFMCPARQMLNLLITVLFPMFKECFIYTNNVFCILSFFLRKHMLTGTHSFPRIFIHFLSSLFSQ